jgi:hypothetical protein
MFIFAQELTIKHTQSQSYVAGSAVSRVDHFGRYRVSGIKGYYTGVFAAKTSAVIQQWSCTCQGSRKTA